MPTKLLLRDHGSWLSPRYTWTPLPSISPPGPRGEVPSIRDACSKTDGKAGPLLAFDWHTIGAIAVAGLLVISLGWLPSLLWIFGGGLCRTIGHKPRLVIEPVGRYEDAGTRLRKVGGRLNPEFIEVPAYTFIPSGLPDSRIVRCQMCNLRLD